MDVVDEHELRAIPDPWDRLDACRDAIDTTETHVRRQRRVLRETVAALYVPWDRSRSYAAIARRLGVDRARIPHLIAEHHAAAASTPGQDAG